MASPKDKQAPWVAKDWTKWTWEDCISVLNFSPWASDMGAIEMGRGSRSEWVQFRSALPVRQALLRNLQIHKHYDKMDAQKQREFDQQDAKQFEELNEQAIGNILILIDHDSSYGGSNDATPGPPPRQIALRISDGTLVLPIQTNKVNYPTTRIDFDAVHNQFEYIFPRTIGGKPLYSASDSDEVLTICQGDPLVVDKKTGKVEPHPFRNAGDDYTIKFVKISKLMYKGKLEY